MLLDELRDVVYRANSRSPQSGLVMGTFGNVSAVDRTAGVFVIKPSGVPYAELTPAHMVAVSLETGEASTASSVPRPIPRRTWSCIARSPVRRRGPHALRVRDRCSRRRGMPIRCMGTTHADYFRGDVPVTRPMTPDEVAHDYEKNTGRVIVETLRRRRHPAVGNAGGAGRQSRSVHLGADAVEGHRARARARVSRAPRVARHDDGRRCAASRAHFCRQALSAQARARRLLRADHWRGPLGSRRDARGLRRLSLAILARHAAPPRTSP